MGLRPAEQVREEIEHWMMRWVEQRTKLDDMDGAANHFLAGRRTGQCAAFEEVLARLLAKPVAEVHADLKRLWATRYDELQARREARARQRSGVPAS